MQPLRFARSLNTIVKKLEVQSLIDFLVQNFQNSGSNLSTETRNRFSKLLFDARSAYDELHADPTTSKILESLQINLIFEVGRLGKMIAALGSAQNFGALMQPAIYPDFATVPIQKGHVPSFWNLTGWGRLLTQMNS
jgi:hypothetical protein